MRGLQRVAGRPHGLVAGQVLLAPLDFVDRRQYLHARGTLVRLLELGWCRSSTRTTPSPTTRSASATTTASPPSSPTSSAPTCSCCSPTRAGLLTADPRLDADASLIGRRADDDPMLERRGRRRRLGPGQRRHGVEAGGGQDRRVVGRAGGDRRAPTGPMCWPTPWPASTGVGTVVRGPRPAPAGPQAVDRVRQRGRGPIVVDDGARRPLRRAGHVAAARRRRRGRRARSTPATRSRSPGPTARCSPGAWRPPTPVRCDGMAGRRTRRPPRRRAPTGSSTATTSSCCPDARALRPDSPPDAPAQVAPTASAGQLSLRAGPAGRRGRPRRPTRRLRQLGSSAGAEAELGADLGQAGLRLDVRRRLLDLEHAALDRLSVSSAMALALA